jgi:hypothetical protein
MNGRTYRKRGRVYCMGSGTQPHPSEARGAPVNSATGRFTRARCAECGREVATLRSGLLSHHGPSKGGK